MNQEKKELSGQVFSLTIYEVKELKSRFITALQDNELLEVNIKDIDKCDTAGLQLLYSAGKTAEDMGKRFIISGESKAIEDAMRRTGITHEMINRDGGAGCPK
jgi:anti-anti-sigma regulatory factor